MVSNCWLPGWGVHATSLGGARGPKGLTSATIHQLCPRRAKLLRSRQTYLHQNPTMYRIWWVWTGVIDGKKKFVSANPFSFKIELVPSHCVLQTTLHQQRLLQPRPWASPSQHKGQSFMAIIHKFHRSHSRSVLPTTELGFVSPPSFWACHSHA